MDDFDLVEVTGDDDDKREPKEENPEELAAIARQSVFTTGDIAKLCKVAPRTVSKWCDTGQLDSYRIPGSLDRRVTFAALVRFLKQNGMPLGALEAVVSPRILLIACEDCMHAAVTKAFNQSAQLITASSAIDAGMQYSQQLPAGIVVNISKVGRREATAIADRSRKDGQIPIVALVADESVDPLKFSEVFRLPVDPVLVAERIRRCIAS